MNFIRAQPGLFRCSGRKEEGLREIFNDAQRRHSTWHRLHDRRTNFTALGVPWLFGRGIRPTDPMKSPFAVIDFWRKILHDDATIVRPLDKPRRAESAALSEYFREPAPEVCSVLDSLPILLGRVISEHTFFSRCKTAGSTGNIRRAGRMDFSPSPNRLSMREMPGRWKVRRGVPFSPVPRRIHTYFPRIRVSVADNRRCFLEMILASTGLCLLIALPVNRRQSACCPSLSPPPPP